MKKSISAALFLTLPCLAFAGALDLTPHPIITAFKGLRVNRYFFEDAGKQMGFRIDNNMTVKGTSASAVFEFGDLKNSGMKILRSPKNPEAPFGEKDLESYRAVARALVPESATDVQVEQEKPGAIAINAWTSYQFVFTYNLSGSAYRRSVIFLNYDKTEQLIMDVSAPSPEFDRVYLRSYQVLNSLSELRTSSSGPT
jgi:hypothetical protein